MGLSQVTVSNNNPEGWSTGVIVLVVAIIFSMAFAIFGNLIGLVSKDRFWGSVDAGETYHHLGLLISASNSDREQLRLALSTIEDDQVATKW